MSIAKGSSSFVLPLTPMQQGMLFDAVASRASDLDVDQFVVELKEEVDTNALRRAWAIVVNRHDALRASFAVQSRGERYQVISDCVELAWSEVKWSPALEVNDRDRLEEFLAADRRTPFELERPPLMRFTLIRTADREATLVWTFHHLILDGRSFWNVLREVWLVYEAERVGALADLPPPRSIREYTDWLEKSPANDTETYWRRALRGFPGAIPLDFGCGRTTGAGTNLGRREYKESLSREETLGLATLAWELKVTPNILFQAFWAVLLARYCGTDDVVFGATRACRGWSRTAGQVVGLIMNVLPVRVRMGSNETLRGMLEELGRQHLAILKVEHTPLIEIRRWSEVPGRESLFESLVNFESAKWSPGQSPFRMAGRRIRLVEHMKPPLGIWAYWGDTVDLKIQYDPNLFHPTIVEHIIGHLRTGIRAAVRNPELRVLDIPLLTEGERQQVVVAWNNTATDYPRDRCVHDLFCEEAEKGPDRVALEVGERRMTYSELYRASRAVAKALLGFGVKSGALVGIVAERSTEMVAGLLGTLMAGGAYVPVDPKDPAVRQEAVLALAGVKVLLDPRPTRNAPRAGAGLPGTVTVIELSEVLKGGEARTNWGEAAFPTVDVGPDDLAYVMFTSGSTGVPKGVAVRHRSIVRLVRNTNFASLDSEQVFLQLAPLAFDASTLEIWGALLNGARVALMPPGLPSLEEIGKALRHHGVSILWLTSGLFNLMVEERLDDLRQVKQILSGGDVLSPSHVARVLQSLDGGVLINGYGPTENTTFTCCHRISDADLERPSIPVGCPISNTRVYVVDRFLRPVPVGVWGELLAAGDGVARGYVNNKELTADRFIDDPFGEAPGGKAYKTGDYCRWLPEGIIEFRGRVDSQVKIRGFRVELGDIESALVKCTGVMAAVVVARAGSAGSKLLVAYWVPSGEEPEPSARELQRSLRAQLPDYMVPSHYVRIESLPVTANGKIDRAALPDPDEVSSRPESGVAPPRNLIEEQLVAVWERVLGVRPIGIHDDFFDLGGHSLLAIRLVSEIEKSLNFQVPVTALLEKVSTVEAMANQISGPGPRVELLPDLCGLTVTDYRHLLANGLSIPGRRFGPAAVFAEVNAGVSGRTPLFLIGSDLLDVFDKVDGDIPLYCSPSVWFIPDYGPNIIQSAGLLLSREIEKIMPDGSVIVSGFCVNAWVAFEVAQELSRRGRTVEILFLIDQYAPPVLLAKIATWIGNYTRGVTAQLARVPWRKRPGFIARKIKSRLGAAVTSDRRPRPNGGAVFPGSVSEALLALVSAYEKRTYNERTDLFLLDHGVFGNLLDRIAWRRLLKGEVHFRHRPGRHDFYSDKVKEELRASFGGLLNSMKPKA